MNKNNIFPNIFINIVPRYKLIYVEVPKAACSTTKTILSRAVTDTELENWEQVHVRKQSGLLSPRKFGLDDFYELVNDPEKPLPFDAFVRMACRSNYSPINGHWSAMSDIVPTDLMGFSQIGRVEAIEDELRSLRDRGIPESAFPTEAVNRKKR